MAGGSLGVVMLLAKGYARSDMGGGVERSAHRLATFLAAEGHRVHVLTRNYDRLSRRADVDGVVVHRFRVWGRSRALASLSYLVQSLAWLVRHRREYDVIHAHQSYAPGTIAALAKRLLRKPVVVKVSTSDRFSEVEQLSRLPLFRLRRRLLSGVDRFVVVNAGAGREFEALGIPPGRITCLPNGVPVPADSALSAQAREAAKRRLGVASPQVVVYAGRLSEEKNLDILVEAWSHVAPSHPDALLLLVGDGGTFRSVEAPLRGQIRALGLSDRVRLTGRVEDVSDYLLAADLFALPSSTEGMSNALLEAMAFGVAAVATRIPGNAAVIEPGVNGLLVDPGDVEGLAAAIRSLLDAPAEAARLGAAARRTVLERYDVERVGRAYLDLYRGLPRAGRVPGSPSAARRLAAVLVGGLAAVALLELAVRRLPVCSDSFPPIYQPHPTRVYEFRPLSSGRSFRGIRYHINEAGQRDEPWSPPGRPDRIRVAILGDSVTMGYGVQAMAAYPQVLEAVLNGLGRGDPVGVMNFGINGYNTIQETLLLEERVLARRPGVVVLGVTGNDFEAAIAPKVIRYGELFEPGSSRVPAGLKRVLRRFGLYWFVSHRLARLQHGEPRYRSGSVSAEQAAADARVWTSYQRVLERFLASAGAARVPVLICYLPGLAELSGAADYDGFRARLAAFFGERGVRFLDLTETLRREGASPRALFLPMDPVHFSPEGHRLVAQAISEAMQRWQLVPSGEPSMARGG
jgi:glycosyltransferase involved in cell wall biosynthesis/lysophospholipase L1-like esterase